jgi:hypothetical protein
VKKTAPRITGLIGFITGLMCFNTEVVGFMSAFLFLPFPLSFLFPLPFAPPFGPAIAPLTPWGGFVCLVCVQFEPLVNGIDT